MTRRYRLLSLCPKFGGGQTPITSTIGRTTTPKEEDPLVTWCLCPPPPPHPQQRRRSQDGGGGDEVRGGAEGAGAEGAKVVLPSVPPFAAGDGNTTAAQPCSPAFNVSSAPDSLPVVLPSGEKSEVLDKEKAQDQSEREKERR